MWKPKSRKTTRRRREFTIIRRFHELQELYVRVLVMGLAGSKKIKNSWKKEFVPQGRRSRSPLIVREDLFILDLVSMRGADGTSVILITAPSAHIDLLQ